MNSESAEASREMQPSSSRTSVVETDATMTTEPWMKSAVASSAEFTDAAAASLVNLNKMSLSDIPGSQIDAKKVKQILSYYFSVENLKKDKYMSEQMDAERYIKISILSNFNKMVQLLRDLNGPERTSYIRDILSELSSVEIDSTGEKVRSVDVVVFELPKVVPSETYHFILIRNVAGGITKVDVAHTLDRFLPFQCSDCFPASPDSFYVIYESRGQSLQAHEAVTKGLCRFGGISANALLKSSSIRPTEYFIDVRSQPTATPTTANNLHPRNAVAGLMPNEPGLGMQSFSMAHVVPAPMGNMTPQVLSSLGHPIAAVPMPVYIAPKPGAYPPMYANVYSWPLAEQAVFTPFGHNYQGSFFPPASAVPFAHPTPMTVQRRPGAKNYQKASRPQSRRQSENEPQRNQVHPGAVNNANATPAAEANFQRQPVEAFPHGRQQNWKNGPRSGRNRRGRQNSINSNNGDRNNVRAVNEPQFDCNAFPPLNAGKQEIIAQSREASPGPSTANQSVSFSDGTIDSLKSSFDGAPCEPRLSYAEITRKKDLEDVNAVNGVGGSTPSSVTSEGPEIGDLRDNGEQRENPAQQGLPQRQNRNARRTNQKRN